MILAIERQEIEGNVQVEMSAEDLSEDTGIRDIRYLQQRKPKK